MRVGIVLESADPQTAWNAFRSGVKALEGGHTVGAFLLGAAVECPGLHEAPHDAAAQMTDFADHGGTLLTCGTCLRSRHLEGAERCPVSTCGTWSTWPYGPSGC